MSEPGFVMVPRWFRKSHPSGNAMIVYIGLASFGALNTDSGVYEECRPSLETLAKETGLSRATVQRAVKELLGAKAITRTLRQDPEGGSLPTVYRVRFNAPDQGVSPVGGGVPSDEHPPVPSDEQGGVPSDEHPGCSPVSSNLEPNTQIPNTQKNTSTPAADAAGKASKDKKAPKEPEPVRPEVERLCQLLADLVATDGTKRPAVTKAWRDECRRLMEIDGASEKQVEYVIRWSQSHSFWSTNILSMPKLRQQYAALVKRIKAEHVKPVSGGAPAKSFKQQEDDHKTAVADYFKQARESWMAAHPGQSASSGPAMAEILKAAKAMENAATASAANGVASCQAMPYSGVIEGESYETTPLAIGGGQS